MTSDILRKKFLQFFASKNHRIVESDSLVPREDPTVLFTPAGMNQFKKHFLGLAKDFSRATTSQRCLRTDDLEKVGVTECHHTFFEMLGNFSFGDYFKAEAIAWAWEFLTVELGIPKEKLWVSVYHDDDEAYSAWTTDIGFPAGKVVKLGDKDNFWPSEAKEKGPNGPCGPCSEIFFDLGASVGCKKPGCSPACSCGRFIEIWNLVFTQFNRKDGGLLEPLPQKNIDTGMGLERICAVMQGVTNNFDTDLFQPIIREICAHGHGDIRIRDARAVADHIRAVIFSLYDGIIPSNESRGYVVRKLIRKSCMHLKALGIKLPFLYTLVPVVCEAMKDAYPDLSGRREDIASAILAEEKNFETVLDSSAELVAEEFGRLNRFQGDELNSRIGAAAFTLYDSRGIPQDITFGHLENLGVVFDRARAAESFSRELAGQKNRSKAQSAMQGDVFSVKEALVNTVAETRFLGYETCSSPAKVLMIIKNGASAQKLSAGESGQVVLDASTFYPESGGQVGDTGSVSTASGLFRVQETTRLHKVIIHTGTVREGEISAEQTARSQVDVSRRMDIARNHTATHLLQAALRKVLGAHVQQQGSLVSDERLRFDFTHFKDVADDELRRIEEVVNDWIFENFPVNKQEMGLREARKRGALAFFEEKYEERVRVVSVAGVSSELCGGTHLSWTGEIGMCAILQECSVSSGVRRIEAVTGRGAYGLFQGLRDLTGRFTQLLNAPDERVVQELEKRLRQSKELEKRIGEYKLKNLSSEIDGIVAKAEKIGGITFIPFVFDDSDMPLLRSAMDMVKQRAGSAVIALASVREGKAMLVLGLTTDIAEKGLSAGALIKRVAPLFGGSGGGRNDFAQAGGTEPGNLEKAFAELRNILGKS